MNNPQEMQYLKKVAKYLRDKGYRVEHPTSDHALLDVWGLVDNSKTQVFHEIYVTMHELNDVITGYWMQGEHDDVTISVNDYGDLYHEDGYLPNLLDGLMPVRQK